MNYKEKFLLWKNNEFFDSKTKEELEELDLDRDEEEIKSRFEQEIVYDKSVDVCGIIGVGTNRINIYTIGKLTASFGIYLLNSFGLSKCSDSGVVVSYGVRKNSFLFANIVARVLSGLGIKVILQKSPMAIAFPSFLVSKIKAIAGVMITADNMNTKFNGLKFYDSNGCEINENSIDTINSLANQISFYNQIDFGGKENLINMVDYQNDFINAVLESSKINEFRPKGSVKIAFTPLFGSGENFVINGLICNGFNHISLVEEEASFNKIPESLDYINIEDTKSFEKAMNLVKEFNLDFILATSFDCEKLAVEIKNGFNFKLLSSSQLSILILDFLLTRTNKSKLENSVVLKTAFSSNIFDKMAKKFNVSCIECGNDFKDISRNISEIGANKNILFAFDNDYGFLIGNHTKSRDAVVTALVFAEIANYYKLIGKSMLDRLKEIYEEFGQFSDFKEEYNFFGDKFALLKEKMELLKISSSPFFGTKNIVYLTKEANSIDMVKFELENGSFVILEANSIEQKLKVIYSILGENEREIQVQKQKYHLTIKAKFDL